MDHTNNYIVFVMVFVMAILGFHFSAPYKKPLLDRIKIATVAEGEEVYNIGTNVELYISDKPNLFEGRNETRFGHGTISECSVMKVSDLTDKHAVSCGHRDLDDLVGALKKWYNADENSSITYIVFNPILYDWGRDALREK